MIGSKFTSKNRLAQQLMAQEQASGPVRSHSQGLAKLLRAGLAGYMQGQDQKDQMAAQQAMAQALQQPPQMAQQPMPQGMQGPPQMVKQSPYAAAARQLSGIKNNQYAAQMAPQMMMQDLAWKQQQDQQENALNQFEEQMKIKSQYSSPKKLVPGRDVPYSPEVFSQLTNIAAARSGATAQAKADVEKATRQAQAKSELPEITAKANYTKNLVDSIVNHPAMGNVIGAPESVSGAAYKVFGSAIPGTQEADFAARLEQLGGRQFLEAFESLKGGGQITEVEGKKATAAMSRLLQTGQPEETYREAAKELQNVLDLGVVRAQRAADDTTSGGGEQSIPQGVTEDDIQETMRANNMTRDEVLNRLRGQ